MQRIPGTPDIPVVSGILICDRIQSCNIEDSILRYGKLTYIEEFLM